MTGLGLYRKFFLFAALYDGLLGLAFLLFYPRIYAWFGITLPNHPGYVQLPALFIAIMGLADYYVYRDMVRNRDIVKIRILMKLAYSLSCFYHYFFGSLPTLWLNIAMFNVVFLVPYFLFLRASTASASSGK